MICQIINYLNTDNTKQLFTTINPWLLYVISNLYTVLLTGQLKYKADILTFYAGLRVSIIDCEGNSNNISIYRVDNPKNNSIFVYTIST